MKNLSPKAKNFLAKKPSLIVTVLGVRFYEHPIHGEDVPLVAITKDGKVRSTAFMEIPSEDDVEYFLESID